MVEVCEGHILDLRFLIYVLCFVICEGWPNALTAPSYVCVVKWCLCLQ